jgi:mono/diheme cytochrome c family protein
MKMWKVATGVSVVAIVVAVGIVADVFPSEIAPIDQIDPAQVTDDLIEQGENLAMLGDCAACHTQKGQSGLSGGVALPTPFGTIYSTNITPDRDTGIGTWSFEAFDRAMRDGIDRRGVHLYPAFPYDHFAAMTEGDMRALYAYVMVQDPVAAPAMPNQLSFPFSFRPLLAGWKLLFHHPPPFAPDPAMDEEKNRGKYLAETIGHCTACHSPRNALGAVRKTAFLQGAEVEGWLAPPLGAASIAPIGWTLDDYADYLFDGWSETHSIAAGPMTNVVDHLYMAQEDDVFAIAAWLAQITPPQDEAERAGRIAKIDALNVAESFDFTLAGLDVSPQVRDGALVFKTNCVKCHKERIADTQPVSLGLTYALNAAAPTNLFRVVIGGIEPPQGSSSRRMQPITLSAEDLAKVAAFVRWQFTDLPEWPDLQKAAEAALSSQTAH